MFVRIATKAAPAIAAVALLAAGCGDGGTEDSAGTAEPGDPAAGQQLYADYCGACHGRDFEGSIQGPSHLDEHFAPGTTSDEDYRRAIRNGTDGSAFDFGRMPAITSLDDQQVEDVIAYIRSVQEERGFDDS
ncbi:MAG: cytochrome c [Microthrixaceae bacterium]|nr:cytochrome c [Microthrixaceae bacterium]